MPTNSDFNDVCVVNSSIIWAGSFSGIIFKTTDSGNSWQQANGNLPSLTIMHITAIDQNKAWISVYNLERGIFMTTDGGNNWTEIYYSAPNFIDKLHFFNANTGYFIADAVHDTLGFFISRNGGLSWYRSPNAPAGLGIYFIVDNMVNQLDTNFIWFNAVSNSTSRFYKLTGGLNNQWQVTIPLSGWSRGTIFKDYQNGLLNASHQVFKSTNAGNNWNQIQNSSLNFVITDFINVPGTDWAILTSTFEIKMSFDFCNTWRDSIIFQSGSFYLHNSDC